MLATFVPCIASRGGRRRKILVPQYVTTCCNQGPLPHILSSSRASAPPKNFFLNTKLNRPDYRNLPSDYDSLIEVADETYFFLPIWNGCPFVAKERVVFWSPLQLREFVNTSRFSQSELPLVARLCDTDSPLANFVAVDVSRADPPPLSVGEKIIPMRAAISFLSETDATLISHARALLNWHSSTKFCSACGGLTEVIHGATARVCRNSECATRNIYPRVMPSVLVLVIRPETDEILLGRKASWAKDRYSVLAGYAEIFESLEHAVAREVLEETGVIVDETSITYHSSQPWPSLPHASLMAAFCANVYGETNAQIKVDTAELESAKWFKRKWLQEWLDVDGGISIPGRTSVARRLISAWLEQRSMKGSYE
ncbi:Peroxisomal NADH pyrophosphatase NUDT12 [Gracilariopsis chorda]|uniref:NAD(+) diphosphatase n=1 Tax=Gracilariopsis chorda TaxID=448386 RepID=A0A2V3IGU1_9FLOR|nr:Peroxisomal NADH pyrophosphatase NUDT12 [Gracilariopsis chorda]|eukprot:PXF41301.1 Peroxisomal NADH pyrophosphatase NUDT12 [Gracilariopsis chorda]